MNLSDLLPAVRAAKANLESQIALAEALGGMTAIQTAESAGSTVATVADVLQRVIDGDVDASAADETELRTIYDDVLTIRNDFDAWRAEAGGAA